MAKEDWQMLAKIIEKHVSYFNGWHVNQKTMERSCEEAARETLSYMKKRAAREVTATRTEGVGPDDER